MEKVKINSDEFLELLKSHGYTRQSMGRVVKCTGRCIGQWMQRGEMPEDLFYKIMNVLNRSYPGPMDIGCNPNGDIFFYHDQPVWIDLHQIYVDGWNACKDTVMKAIE